MKLAHSLLVHSESNAVVVVVKLFLSFSITTTIEK